MTRKDYIAIASVFNDRKGFIDSTYDGETHTLALLQVANLAEEICYILEQDNPNFDKQRFLVACGVTN